MPNSILWIGLVVLWVFVLFPMLANRHPRIRQHTDAALSTRILHRGGAEQRARKGPATGHDTDPDYVPVRRKLHPSEDPEDRMTRSDDSAAASDEAPVATAEVPEPEGDSADTVEMADSAAESDSEAAESRSETAASRAEPAESETVFETATDEGESENDGAVADDADHQAERAERREAPQRARTPALREPDPQPEPEPESDDGDEDFVPSRRGRGGFDPEADAAARAARYTFRQRAVLGLVLSTLILAAAGLAISAVLWWLCALSGTVLVAYLGYLRRQVRIEEDIRRRRAARLARKRAEDDEDAAEPHRPERPRPDREQTRTQLRRAVLVESDDEDPLFEHLDLFDAAAARATRQRAAGARERRAVGE
ncbi:divisome protein SepX/GlpR [Nocardia niigatensis]|uniref:divisome protein SepX/GlpR n=1 Tax=Nocardia niigatensis TaxID=209249 RepID=UPI000300A63A|nr:gephyrin-like molybdotransferase receptor GlpR [Nocardia niigatensis]